MFVLITFFIVALILAVWLVGFLFANDFSVVTQNLKKYKNVLIIFPHADDEVLNSGGLIHTLSQQSCTTTLVILTKGEKGTSDGYRDSNLKNIRVTEAQQAAHILGVTKLIQEDFGDGELIHKKPQLAKYIDGLLKIIQPDLVVTYDPAGLYGHPDHIVVSEVVTALMKKITISTPLWYVSFPKKVLSMIKLPEQMAHNSNFKSKRVYPTLKIFAPFGVIPKIKAVYAYKSQYESFRNAIPFKFIPLWFFYSMQVYEYFAKAN